MLKLVIQIGTEIKGDVKGTKGERISTYIEDALCISHNAEHGHT